MCWFQKRNLQVIERPPARLVSRTRLPIRLQAIVSSTAWKRSDQAIRLVCGFQTMASAFLGACIFRLGAIILAALAALLPTT
jgi:hypothetical protein